MGGKIFKELFGIISLLANAWRDNNPYQETHAKDFQSCQQTSFLYLFF